MNIKGALAVLLTSGLLVAGINGQGKSDTNSDPTGNPVSIDPEGALNKAQLETLAEVRESMEEDAERDQGVDKEEMKEYKNILTEAGLSGKIYVRGTVEAF